MVTATSADVRRLVRQLHTLGARRVRNPQSPGFQLVAHSALLRAREAPFIKLGIARGRRINYFLLPRAIGWEPRGRGAEKETGGKKEKKGKSSPSCGIAKDTSRCMHTDPERPFSTHSSRPVWSAVRPSVVRPVRDDDCRSPGESWEGALSGGPPRRVGCAAVLAVAFCFCRSILAAGSRRDARSVPTAPGGRCGEQPAGRPWRLTVRRRQCRAARRRIDGGRAGKAVSTSTTGDGTSRAVALQDRLSEQSATQLPRAVVVVRGGPGGWGV